MSDLCRHLQLFAEPSRVRLLAVLDQEEFTVGELVQVVQMPQSTVSRHLKALLEAGWVKRRTEGSASLYRSSEASPTREAGQIWDTVSGDWTRGLTYREDHARLGVVLTARSEQAQTLFARIHAEWDAMRDQLFGPDLLSEALLGLLGADWSVADLGCGTGEAVTRLAALVGQVHGVDAEPAMLEVARSRCASLPNVSLHNASMDALPLPSGSIDLALAMLVFHHVRDLQEAMSEVARVVRPGGRLLVLDMASHARSEWADSLGHAHQGFDAEVFRGLVDWRLTRWRAVAPRADVLGPPLFVAVLERASDL